MIYNAITNKDDITAAYEILQAILKQDAEELTRSIGWQGGGGEYSVYWHKDLTLWGLVVAMEDHYWFGWGSNDVTKTNGLVETVQINFDREKGSRMYGGQFVSDDTGNVYVAHSGRIGGGRKGISRTNFLQSLKAKSTQFAEVNFSTKAKHEYVILGKLSEGAELLVSIANFARNAKEFKDMVAAPKQ